MLPAFLIGASSDSLTAVPAPEEMRVSYLDPGFTGARGVDGRMLPGGVREGPDSVRRVGLRWRALSAPQAQTLLGCLCAGRFYLSCPDPLAAGARTAVFRTLSRSARAFACDEGLLFDVEATAEEV